MIREDSNFYACDDVSSDVAERLLAPRTSLSETLLHKGYSRHAPRQRSAMNVQCLIPTSLLLWTLFLATFNYAAADDPRGAIVLDQRQQDTLYPMSFEDYEAAQVPAKLMALMRMTSQQQQERMMALQGGESEPEEDEPAEPLPVPLPMYASKEDSKRGSYMSLCHFKICNMGRKRNLRPIPRNRF